MGVTPDGLPIAPARYTLTDAGRAALAASDARTDGLAARLSAVAEALYDATARVRVAQRRADADEREAAAAALRQAWAFVDGVRAEADRLAFALALPHAPAGEGAAHG